VLQLLLAHGTLPGASGAALRARLVFLPPTALPYALNPPTLCGHRAGLLPRSTFSAWGRLPDSDLKVSAGAESRFHDVRLASREKESSARVELSSQGPTDIYARKSF
jgi:hypothetical protein